jgi:hypothetical protein
VEGENRKSISAGETAAAVARLVVAALMERREPRRLRVSIRKGGPEDLLMTKCARRIEESYRNQQISHFHDGFVVLTKERVVQAH